MILSEWLEIVIHHEMTLYLLHELINTAEFYGSNCKYCLHRVKVLCCITSPLFMKSLFLFWCCYDDGCQVVLWKYFDELADIYACLHKLGFDGWCDKRGVGYRYVSTV